MDCSAFLLDDVLLEVQVLELLVPLEAVLEVVVLEVVLLVVLPWAVEVVVLEVVEVDLVVVVELVVVVLVVVQLLEDDISRNDVLLLKVVEVLSGFEVDVTELWPVDVLQEVDAMLFLMRCTSDLSASVSTSSWRWMLTVLQR